MRGKDGQLHDTKSTQTLETRDCRNTDAFPFFLLKTTTSVLNERQKRSLSIFSLKLWFSTYLIFFICHYVNFYCNKLLIEPLQPKRKTLTASCNNKRRIFPVQKSNRQKGGGYNTKFQGEVQLLQAAWNRRENIKGACALLLKEINKV